MAISKADQKMSYPLPVYNYRVEIDGTTMSFSEVSGLSIAYEATTYKESPGPDDNPGPKLIQMPAQATPPTITLKRGIIRGDRMIELYEWLSSVEFNLVDKKDITINLCDEKGETVIIWKVINAFPKKLDAPSFTADSNDAAIESMELGADDIKVSKP
jgi:phage tail-like protein